MKLIDWYNFNFCNEQFKCNIGDIYVKAFRRESHKNEDVILETLMKPSDMVELFGDFKIFLLGKDTKNDYCTLRVCICKENDHMGTETEKDDGETHVIEKITLDMTYGYKGSSNCTVTLQKNVEDGTISVITDYGETVATCTSGHQVATILSDLNNEKYA